MSTSTFPIGPLLDAAGVQHTVRGVMGALRVNGVMARRLLDRPLTPAEADRYALRLGRHAAEVWPEWHKDASQKSTGNHQRQLAALPDPDEQPLMEVEEVAEAGIFPMGRDGIYNAIRRGEIPSVKVGRRIFVLTAGLRRMVGLS